MTWSLYEVVPDVGPDAALGVGVVVEAVVCQTLLTHGTALVPRGELREGGDDLHSKVRTGELTTAAILNLTGNLHTDLGCKLLIDGRVVGQQVPDGHRVLFLVAIKQTGTADGQHEVADESPVRYCGVACEVQVFQQKDDAVW